MDINSPEAALWSENMRLKSENEHLRAALKPFADIELPDEWETMVRNADRDDTIITVKCGDLRLARKALSD